jgi:hypothetical protein
MTNIAELWRETASRYNGPFVWAIVAGEVRIIPRRYLPTLEKHGEQGTELPEFWQQAIVRNLGNQQQEV